MKLGKWKITFNNIWAKKEIVWLYRWQYRFILFATFSTDLAGQVIILNFQIKWEKMFK